MRKTLKTACRSCFFIKNCKKQRFAYKRRAKNGESGASGHPERLKFGKTMFRDAPTTCFWRKWTVGESRSLKISRNKLSGSPEARKIWKTSFRGVPKPQNFKKQAFGEPRSSKNLKNKLSGSPEAREIWKMGPRGAPKRPNVIFPSAKWWLKAENAGCWLNMIALHITETPLQLLS